MARSQNQCPVCKAEAGPGYRYCLACGAELNPGAEYAEPQPEPEAAPEPKPEKKWGRKKKEAVAPAPSAPEAYSYSYAAYAAIEGPPEVNPKAKKRSGGRLRGFLLFLLLIAGAVGGMMYWNDHPTIAEGRIPGRISWEAVRDGDLGNAWITTEESTKQALLAQVPAGAVEATVTQVSTDGLVTIELRSRDVPVRLAGVSVDFALQCLGEKGVDRVGRALPEGAVVYVLLDGDGRVNTKAEGEQSVYIWRMDIEGKKLRFINQELVASGEAEFVPVVLSNEDPAISLNRAWMRAQDKQRGRYAEGACI
jgi:hypothetical protein